ncbi:MAG: hypothetical protein ABIH23_30060, partial [bacterium]
VIEESYWLVLLKEIQGPFVCDDGFRSLVSLCVLDVALTEIGKSAFVGWNLVDAENDVFLKLAGNAAGDSGILNAEASSMLLPVDCIPNPVGFVTLVEVETHIAAPG